jgi:hypothetical protein
MPPRLIDRFTMGDSVLITFDEGENWIPGTVIRHQHPGVWVKTPDGYLWFVTNGKRIREFSETASRSQSQSGEDN